MVVFGQYEISENVILRFLFLEEKGKMKSDVALCAVMVDFLRKSILLYFFAAAEVL